MSATAPGRGVRWAGRDPRPADDGALLAALDACDAVLVLVEERIEEAGVETGELEGDGRAQTPGGASSRAAPTSAGHGEWMTNVGTRSR